MLRVAGNRLSSLNSWIPISSASAIVSGNNPINGIASSEDSGFTYSSHAFTPKSPFLDAIRGFGSESLVPKNDMGLSDVPATVAAVKNPTPKIEYDYHNHKRFPPGDPSKRAFAYFVLTGGRFVYASLLWLFILKFVLGMSASKDVLALASLEVDLSALSREAQ